MRNNLPPYISLYDEFNSEPYRGYGFVDMTPLIDSYSIPDWRKKRVIAFCLYFLYEHHAELDKLSFLNEIESASTGLEVHFQSFYKYLRENSEIRDLLLRRGENLEDLLQDFENAGKFNTSDPLQDLPKFYAKTSFPLNNWQDKNWVGLGWHILPFSAKTQAELKAFELHIAKQYGSLQSFIKESLTSIHRLFFEFTGQLVEAQGELQMITSLFPSYLNENALWQEKYSEQAIFLQLLLKVFNNDYESLAAWRYQKGIPLIQNFQIGMFKNFKAQGQNQFFKSMFKNEFTIAELYEKGVLTRNDADVKAMLQKRQAENQAAREAYLEAETAKQNKILFGKPFGVSADKAIEILNSGSIAPITLHGSVNMAYQHPNERIERFIREYVLPNYITEYEYTVFLFANKLSYIHELIKWESATGRTWNAGNDFVIDENGHLTREDQSQNESFIFRSRTGGNVVGRIYVDEPTRIYIDEADPRDYSTYRLINGKRGRYYEKSEWLPSAERLLAISRINSHVQESPESAQPNTSKVSPEISLPKNEGFSTPNSMTAEERKAESTKALFSDESAAQPTVVGLSNQDIKNDVMPAENTSIHGAPIYIGGPPNPIKNDVQPITEPLNSGNITNQPLPAKPMEPVEPEKTKASNKKYIWLIVVIFIIFILKNL